PSVVAPQPFSNFRKGRKLCVPGASALKERVHSLEQSAVHPSRVRLDNKDQLTSAAKPPQSPEPVVGDYPALVACQSGPVRRIKEEPVVEVEHGEFRSEEHTSELQSRF